jgi:Na+/H+ antiporter NhaD/arsenite permease-like protein
MIQLNRKAVLVLGLMVASCFLAFTGSRRSQAQSTSPGVLLFGKVLDRQGQPVADARISVFEQTGQETLAESATQPDGEFALPLPQPIPNTLIVSIERAHFKPAQITLDASEIQNLHSGQSVVLQDTILLHNIGIAFWLSTIVFIGVLALIAFGKLHNTLAALVGASILLALSYLGPLLDGGLFVFTFPRALYYVDWNVIFLVMGMMIVIAVVEGTGIFQWLAFTAYRISGGRTWLLMAILMIITGFTSAFLDNVTTMLLMTPITIQIALGLGIMPLALLIPEVLASNVVGISTLIGTPTNILIGSYAGISFTSFLSNLTPGVLLALAGLIVYCELIYKRELKADSSESISELLIAKLAERAKITEPSHLKKAGVVGAGMLLLFILGEHVQLQPAVTALMGATALLVWIKPDIQEMIEAVDWTTLVFFISLFICVGAIQEVGLISFIADGVAAVVGHNLPIAMLAIIWLSAILSTFIANIPFTAAMLPVIGFLTAIIPGADSKVLFYCLSVGSALGGNGSLIGASANMVTAGIAERAGYPVTYLYFLKKGGPALLITVSLATVWLFLHFH